jgi:hypothetical protein
VLVVVDVVCDHVFYFHLRKVFFFRAVVVVGDCVGEFDDVVFVCLLFDFVGGEFQQEFFAVFV